MIRLTLLLFGLLVIPLMYDAEALHIIPANVTVIVGDEDAEAPASTIHTAEDRNSSDVCADDTQYQVQGAAYQFGADDHLSIIDCYRFWMEFNTTSIPDDALILNVVWKFQTASTFGGKDCIIRHLDHRGTENWGALGNATAGTTMFEDAGNGTIYHTGTGTSCLPVGTNKEIDFNDFANADLQARLVDNWFGWGVQSIDELSTGGNEFTMMGGSTPDMTLEVTWTHKVPDAVVDLIAVVIGDTAIDLSWTQPDLMGSASNGSQINFTTPFGDPLTIVTNNTNVNDTAVSVTGLSSDTPYSFRVSVWTVEGGNNASGNIANATSADFGNFTVGFFDLEASQFDARDIKYLRIDEANDIIKLEVVYPNAFNLTCTFDYRFQNTNQTFNNLVTVPEGFVEQKATFQFNNASREFIGIRCTDVNTNASAPFQLTITQFPILDQLEAYRAGQFGTDGMLGAIDIITLLVVVLIMIGFNRWNESVGGIFAVGLLGGLAFFNIVEWQTFMFGTLAIVIMLIVASTRKT